MPACSTTTTGCGTTPDNSGWTTILKQQIKLANQKDLFLGASLQCGIVTDTTVKSLNGSLDSAEAQGTIRVKIAIDTPSGTTVYAEPTSGRNATGAADSDGVVFCDRIQTLGARFSGLNCTANLVTGAVTCSTPRPNKLRLRSLLSGLAHGVQVLDVKGAGDFLPRLVLLV